MNRPIYASAAQLGTSRKAAGHAGLWFAKFCNTWYRDGDAWAMKGDKKDNPKLDWLQTLVGSPVGTKDQIEEYASRLVRLVKRNRGLAAVFKTESRFVTGLGLSHPVENGFAWHPILGTPYLPGSSVKGMIRAWAKQSSDQSAGNEKIRKRLLGSPRQAGLLCFLDAVPTSPVSLEIDVMTPHFAGWNEKDLPGDWRSPTPIPFLVAAPGTSLHFGILPIRPVEDGDLSVVQAWLRDALVWAGAGAKTAVGYGRFCRDDNVSRWTARFDDEDRQRIEERNRRESMRTPEGRWRLEIKGRSETEVLENVRIHLEKEPLTNTRERRAFAHAVLSTDFVESWRIGRPNDSRTNVGKKKLKQRARLVDDAIQAM